MRKNTKQTFPIVPTEEIGKLSQDDMLRVWRKARYDYFMNLKSEHHMTNEQIGEMVGVSRQAVGSFIREARKAFPSVV